MPVSKFMEYHHGKYCEFKVSSGSGSCTMNAIVYYDRRARDVFWHIHKWEGESVGIGIERMGDLIAMKEDFASENPISEEELQKCLERLNVR